MLRLQRVLLADINKAKLSSLRSTVDNTLACLHRRTHELPAERTAVYELDIGAGKESTLD